MSNPFLTTKSKPGHGTIHLGFLPPNTPRLRTINYQYPLKLVSPAPLHAGDELIHTVYLLTYGGGIVAGDSIDLNVIIERTTRLILLTQGSTKLFKAPDNSIVSTQRATVDLQPGAALCYLPDPVQPFERSCFEQNQIYNITVPESGLLNSGSFCVLDWVSNGRPANGEDWAFYRYASKNEIYLCQQDGNRRLLLRDNIFLDSHGAANTIAARMDNLAVFGTLILFGPLFQDLGQFFMEEFKALPRIGGRKWDSGSDSGEEEDSPPALAWRMSRQHQETADRVVWSSAVHRNCVVIKFSAKEVEGGRKWLRSMLQAEGNIERLFGERAFLCLR